MPTVEAGIPTFRTSHRLKDRRPGRDVKFLLQRRGLVGTVLGLAIGAKDTHQALGQHSLQRGGDQIGLNAHVHQASQRTGGIVGVQRGKNQMAGQRRLHGDPRCFLVANFADQDHIGVVPKNRTQADAKGQAGFLRDLDLVDAPYLVFDGILHCDNLADHVVDLAHGGVKRGRLAGTGRAGDQKNAMRHAEDFTEDTALFSSHAKIVQAEQGVVLLEQAHHHRFAMQHWNDGDANVDLGTFDPELDASILR